MVLLHGLFGSGSNLGALARSLQDRYRVHTVDLPNHGRSPWLEQASLGDIAACLRDWLLHQGLASAHWIGHSLGGKVAMQLALDSPELVDSMVVVDIAPVDYPSHHDAVFSALEAVVAAQCESREQAASIMGEYLPEAELIQFLLMSLRRGEGGIYRWRFNLAGIRDNYRAVRAAPGAAAPYRGPVLFVKGGESDYIREDHRTHILALFPEAGLRVLPGCGHWLHAQRPTLFNSVVGRFLQEREG